MTSRRAFDVSSSPDAAAVRSERDVSFVPMEDVSIEELIAEIVANPTPARVSPQPPPRPAPAPTQRTVVGKIVRRLTGRR